MASAINPTVLSTYSRADLSAWEVLLAGWRLKWIGLLIVFALGLAAGLLASYLPKQYQASVSVSPVAENASSGRIGALSSVLSDIGGISGSLGGLMGNDNNQKAESIALLQSEEITSEYIRSKGLLQVLYADLWDADQSKWKTEDPRKKPTVWKANQYFKRSIRKVLVDARTGIVTLSIKWTDPAAAAMWANDLVQRTNEYQRKRAIGESERNIAYLSDQAVKTDIVGVKQAVYAILQSEVSKAMLARGRDEYALKVLDRAVPPEVAVSPSRLLWGLVGMLAGLLVWIAMAFGSSFLSRTAQYTARDGTD